jgi:hypothetical protein
MHTRSLRGIFHRTGTMIHAGLYANVLAVRRRAAQLSDWLSPNCQFRADLASLRPVTSSRLGLLRRNIAFIVSFVIQV